ncbi:MAG: T9SS type A sorting domain-containing protein [Bacteroidota bacterium]
MQKRLLYMIIGLGIWLAQPLDGQITLGQWRTHLPYKYCNLVEATNDRVFCSATGGLFYFNLEDNSVEKISKIDGLSDNGVSAMRWSGELETLILAYQNSNLDIIRDGLILNLPDIMKKQIPGDKSINDIYFLEQSAFLSTGFGIILMNLEKNEISETYYIGDNGEALKVNQVTTDGSFLYAATEQGIRRGLLSDPFLVDFNAWETITDIPNSNGEFNTIAYYKGAFFTSYNDPAGEQDIVYYDTGSGWIPYPYFTGEQCHEIVNQGEFLTLVDNTGANVISGDWLVVQQLESGKPRSVSVDDHGDLWMADYGGGLITNEGGGKWSIVPNGPNSATVYDMEAAGNILYAVQGGVSGSWNNLFISATLESFKDEQWAYHTNWDGRDLITLTVDPNDPDHLFAGSWGYGLFEFRDEQPDVRYTDANSSLQSIFPGRNFVRIGGIAYDHQGNLWITNTGVSEPISVLKSDGTWKSFRADNLITNYSALGNILVTQSGHKWIIVPKGNGLFAMNDNFTIDDTSDDEYRKVSVVDKFGKVITNDVRSFAEDRNGNLWLGTNQGILVMYSPYRLFTEGTVIAQEVLISRNDDSGLADPLLGTQVVTAIEVDGANRKWLGTAGGGVYLVSDDGFETIEQFNSSNSPLLSNSITDICVDGVSGEVFFGTDKGIISYKGDALQGSTRYNNVVVYPNPVRETYEGPVAIKGLVERTNVKIVDMGGNLVYETESLGGQALWDGTNFRGERVATGVYMIYLSDSDGILSHVTKLLFIH